MAATACDQGFSVAPSADGGESRPTPAVAFKTPRTEPTTEAEPTPTAESAETPISETDESPPTETPEPTSAPATATPTIETTATETPTETPAPTVERTLVPAASPTAAAEQTPEAEQPASEDTISPEMQEWLIGIFQNLTAGRTAVRPYEFDPALAVVIESNNFEQVIPSQFWQAAFDSKVRSSYFVHATRPLDPTDPAQARLPVLLSESILVHESEVDASSFMSVYRDFALALMGRFSDQFILSRFPDAQPSFQEDTGFGVADEEFILVGEYDLGAEGPAIRPQVYIMTGRHRNVNFGLMVLYLDSQSRMRPFALFDRIVTRIG